MKDNQTLVACEQGGEPLPFQTNPPDRILVVDDDASIRRINAEVLSRCGYEVETAEDGAAAWEALSDGSFDLMITDNNMPNLSGVELLRKLHLARMGLPVIMATGKSPEDQLALTPGLRPDAVLLKPYTIEQLLGTVKKVMRETNLTAPSPIILRDRDLSDHQGSLAVASAAAPRPGALKSHDRILVVDEDSDLRLRYAAALDRLGFYVDAAQDGEAGWETLQAESYQLLITENEMPNLSGVELVGKLRAAHMALPVVMAAGRLPTLEQLSQNPPLQLAAILLKPFATDALVDTVKNVLRATTSPHEQANSPSSWRSQPPSGGLRL